MIYDFIYNCVHLLVFVDDYMDGWSQDITITRQACSTFCHDFWISLYSFFGSLFLSSVSTFHFTTLLLESAEERTTETGPVRHNSKLEGVV
jgi:hypothetical protein